MLELYLQVKVIGLPLVHLAGWLRQAHEPGHGRTALARPAQAHVARHAQQPVLPDLRVVQRV
jgi:hypothetical protein